MLPCSFSMRARLQQIKQRSQKERRIWAPCKILYCSNRYVMYSRDGPFYWLIYIEHDACAAGTFNCYLEPSLLCKGQIIRIISRLRMPGFYLVSMRSRFSVILSKECIGSEYGAFLKKRQRFFRSILTNSGGVSMFEILSITSRLLSRLVN